MNAILATILIAWIWLAVPIAAFAQGKIDEQFVVGKVRTVTDAKVNSDLKDRTGMVSRQQLALIEIKEGPFAGKSFNVLNEITDNPAFNVHVEPGREVILSIVTEAGKKPELNIADYHRAPVLLELLAVFLVAFLVFGGKQGVKSLIGLLITVCLIAFVLLPLSLKGVDPLLTAVGICIVATGQNMLLVAGRTKKALAAILGIFGGVIIAGVASQLVITFAPLTGLSSEEAQILRGSVLVREPSFYSGLLAAGMLIGALGVIMDVGISIASAVQEVSRRDLSLSIHELYLSGMNVGRDIMGTMTTTLILAYTGTALPLLLLATMTPSVKFINLDLVATEIAAALTGSLGLVATIPLTAFCAAKLMSQSSSNAKALATPIVEPEGAQ